MTSFIILLLIAVVFAVDALLVYQKQPSISEVSTHYINSNPWRAFLVGLAFGILIGHFLFTIY